MRRRLTFLLLTVAAFGWLWQPAPAPALAQSPPVDYAALAQATLARMSVAQRVGQLFLVTFYGASAESQSDIANLITRYNVGGVVLQAGNDNITDLNNAPEQVAGLVTQLQLLATEGVTESAEISPTLSSEPPAPRLPIPLFVALQHEGDGPPYTEILHGLTPIPNQMAIGATWKPTNAQTVGAIVGRELSALGVNMLLGPSLDILENPNPDSQSDLGTRAFGGDPYWVGAMGQAYTRGVRQGSQGRMAIIAKHFPGYGGSDRPLNEEIATVRKSLNQLQQFDLIPFFAVTAPGGVVSPTVSVDGLLTTHIRYQGLSGNIRATTAPVSFSPAAQAELMALPELAAWRAGGGVVVSDALGVRAVQRFYDDTGRAFPHRQVAKDAFLAGNDILFLAHFALDASASPQAENANIRDTIQWFQERYQAEASFQQRVDASVVRILQLKLRLFGPDFDYRPADFDPTAFAKVVDEDSAGLAAIPAQSVTLISPPVPQQSGGLPAPPTASERIVIFTQVRNSSQCRACPTEPYIGLNALQERLLALYGPQASGQIRASQVRSFSFRDLSDFLNAGGAPITLPTPPPTATPGASDGEEIPTPTPAPPPPGYLVQDALAQADWILFALLDAHSGATPGESSALQRFLNERPDLARSRKVVVFAYNAPYFLDATNISKLGAYFGVYSKVPTFIDASMQALFNDLALEGNPPVNISGIGYDLFVATQPDPEQQIALFIYRDGTALSPSTTQPIQLEAGATLEIRTGVLHDRNGNTVPDGTVVRFIQEDLTENLLNVVTESTTRDGVAAFTFSLPEGLTGRIRVTAGAGETNRSDEVYVLGNEASVITPTPEPTHTPTPSPSPTPTFTPTPLPSPTPRPTPTPVPPPREPTLEITLAQVGTLFGILGGLALTLTTAWLLNRQMPLPRLVRQSLWGLLAALLVYNYAALGLPGSGWFTPVRGWQGLALTALGGTLGLGLFQWRDRPNPPLP